MPPRIRRTRREYHRLHSARGEHLPGEFG